MATLQQTPAPTTTELPPRRRNVAIGLGILLTLIGMGTYPYSVQFPVLRDFPWINLPLVLIGVYLLVKGFWQAVREPTVYKGRLLGGMASLLAIAIAAFFIYGVFFVTRQMPAPTELAMSLTNAPDFTLTNLQGQPVKLSDYRGKKVVLAFYRGYW